MGEPPVDRTDEPLSDASSDPAPLSQETWESGLEWGDVSLIRRQLALTPAERLRSMQSLINKAFEIRSRNAK